MSNDETVPLKPCRNLISKWLRIKTESKEISGSNVSKSDSKSNSNLETDFEQFKTKKCYNIK